MIDTHAARSTNRRLIVLALMMAIALAALDSSVVGTAMPTVVGSLGGLSSFSWVFSVYLLTSTVTVPVYGKLADLYGRKPLMLFGAAVFLAGSMLCGAAQSMEMLIVCRAIQGLGAGAVLPIAMTIMGDIFSIEERARIQAFTSGVWGVSGVLGPTVGGLLTDHIGWRYVFFVNLPFGIATLLLVSLFYVESTRKRDHVLDYWGAILLTGSVVALLLGLLQSVDSYGWLGGPTLALFATSAVLLLAFLWQERRSPEPVIPLSLFENKVIRISSLAVFLAGSVGFGVSSFVPLFEQGVFEGSATRAGVVMIPMSLSWVFAAIASGKLIVKTGFYLPAMIGGASIFTGSVIMLGLRGDTTIFVACIAGLFLGSGMGLTMNSSMIAVQNAVDWSQRGVATATNQFFRTIGGSICVAVMGALMNSRLSHRLAGIDGAPADGNTDILLNAEQRATLPENVLHAMQNALAASLHEMFFITLACAALCLAVVAFFPRGRASELASNAPSSTPQRVPRAEPTET